MKPVDQTRYGFPGGNCFMACVASILEIPLEGLPDLYDVVDAGGEWWNATQDAIGEHRWTMFHVGWGEPANYAPQGWAIAGGPSPRAIGEPDHPGHAVVCYDGEIVHDPHPDRTGLAGPVDNWYVLIPPKVARRAA